MNDFRSYSAAFHASNNDIYHYGVKGMKWNHHKKVLKTIPGNNPLNSYFLRENWDHETAGGKIDPKRVAEDKKYISSKNYSNLDDRSLEVRKIMIKDELKKEKDSEKLHKLNLDMKSIIAEQERRKNKKKKPKFNFSFKK